MRRLTVFERSIRTVIAALEMVKKENGYNHDVNETIRYGGKRRTVGSGATEVWLVTGRSVPVSDRPKSTHNVMDEQVPFSIGVFSPCLDQNDYEATATLLIGDVQYALGAIPGVTDDPEAPKRIPLVDPLAPASPVREVLMRYQQADIMQSLLAGEAAVRLDYQMQFRRKRDNAWLWDDSDDYAWVEQ